ncbi:MAG: DUF1573 domain-containing protein [Parcubacteria group bacterium]|nr:DUF1573 domain-containing protein [Parcubacteria group bacterium]
MGNKQLVIFGAILLLVVLGLMFVAQGDSTENQNAALPTGNGATVLLAGEDFFDFGTISMRNGKVSSVFSVQNDGETPMMIQSVYTSCMCTEAFISDTVGKKHGPFGMPGHTSPRTDIEVGAGETVSVEAVFDPAAHGPSGVGLAERSIYLETNSATQPRVELRFKAVVTR